MDSAPARIRALRIRSRVAQALHGWIFPTRTLQKNLFGRDGGESGEDDKFASRGFENIGAWILGRNMSGPGKWEAMA